MSWNGHAIKRCYLYENIIWWLNINLSAALIEASQKAHGGVILFFFVLYRFFIVVTLPYSCQAKLGCSYPVSISSQCDLAEEGGDVVVQVVLHKKYNTCTLFSKTDFLSNIYNFPEGSRAKHEPQITRLLRPQEKKKERGHTGACSEQNVQIWHNPVEETSLFITIVLGTHQYWKISPN